MNKFQFKPFPSGTIPALIPEDGLNGNTADTWQIVVLTRTRYSFGKQPAVRSSTAPVHWKVFLSTIRDLVAQTTSTSPPFLIGRGLLYSVPPGHHLPTGARSRSSENYQCFPASSFRTCRAGPGPFQFENLKTSARCPVGQSAGGQGTWGETLHEHLYRSAHGRSAGHGRTAPSCGSFCSFRQVGSRYLMQTVVWGLIPGGCRQRSAQLCSGTA